MNIEDQINQSELIGLVRAAVQEADELWIVGGAVRDLVAGKSVEDFDLVTSADPGKIARTLANKTGSGVFRLSHEFGCWRVVAGDRSWHVDICPLRGGSIEHDLALRDFTVNSIALPLAGGELIDPFAGAEDLRGKTLRLTSDQAFKDDPVRVLRLSRFYCQYGLVPDQSCLTLAKQDALRVKEAAGERLLEEFKKLVTADNPLPGFELMDETGVTESLLPELKALQGIEQTPYHHLDAYGHTLEVLERMISIERDPSILGDCGPQVLEQLKSDRGDGLTTLGALRLAALFHDIGKSTTKTVDEEGRVKFFGHDQVGAEFCGQICARLHTSRKLRTFLENTTRHHLHLGFLVYKQPLDRHQIYNYISTCEPVALAVTVLTVADRLATRGARTKQSAIDDHLELAAKMLQEILAWSATKPLISGRDLVAAFNLEEGPLLGELLAAAREAQFVGEVADRESAIRLAEQLLKKR